MTIATFIAKNALRNKRRATLSILSVSASLFLFVTLLVALRELTQPPEDLGASLRIAVRSKISLANVLPARQRSVLEKIPGVVAVTPFTFFGGKYRDEEMTTFAQFAMDPAQLTNIFGEAKMPLKQLESWIKDRKTCVVGKITADRYKLSVGDKMLFTGTFWPCDLELKVAGIFQGTLDDRSVFFHQKRLDEALGLDAGLVGTWWVRARSAEEVPAVITQINLAFANTSAEVRAETERAFQLSFISMMGDVKLLIGSICSVVVFTLLLVSASTMSMAVRERFRELAVLKALGFRRRELFAFILAESFGLAMVGALIGVGGAWLLFSNIDIAALSNGILITFEVSPRIVGLASLVAAVLGIVASIAPAISVAKMSVVNGLKTLD